MQTRRNFPFRLGLINMDSATITLWREKNGAHFILVLHSITMPIRVIWGGGGYLLKLRERPDSVLSGPLSQGADVPAFPSFSLSL